MTTKRTTILDNQNCNKETLLVAEKKPPTETRDNGIALESKGWSTRLGRANNLTWTFDDENPVELSLLYP